MDSRRKVCRTEPGYGIQMENTPLGRISVVEDGTGICDIYIGGLEDIRNYKNATAAVPGSAEEMLWIPEKETPLLLEARRQLQEYFDGTRKEFALPLSVSGTEFQKKVWSALQTIPYGETISYKQLAEKVGNPKACRAVGMANNRNRIVIVIPCHRVIGSNGSLVGYGGGIENKKKLLELEESSLNR